MDTNMTPIDDSNIPPSKTQMDFMGKISEEEEDQRFYPSFNPPPMQQQQMYPVHEQTKDIFTGFDKTAYVIVFITFILGFFMVKTMQPVILRPN